MNPRAYARPGLRLSQGLQLEQEGQAPASLQPGAHGRARFWTRLLAPVMLSALLAACGSAVKLDEGAGVPVESRTGSGAGTGAASESQVATVDLKGKDAAGGANLPRTIYFDFDSYVVRDDGRPVVDLHARRLSGNGNLKMVVEGHTDDRGGREYNLALGQKRAEAVVKALTLLGARESQLEAVSFGMERPAALGSDEAAWAKNRRAELKDR